MYKNLSKIALPLFVFWPFGAFLFSLFDFKSKSSAIVYVLFVTVFGYSFTFQDTSADSYRVAMVFDFFDFSTLSNIYFAYQAGGLTDLYRFFLYGLTKMFTNNPKVLFALFGFVFGIFSYLSIRLVVNEKRNRHGIYWSIIIFLFFASNPITNINGARFWTATLIFFYSTANFLFYNKKGWIIGILSTPLVHFSFLFVIPPVFLFYFFQKFFYSSTVIRSWLFISFVVLFFVSFFLETNSIKIGFLSESSFLSSSVSKKVDLYNSDRITEAVDARSSSLFHTVTRYFGYIKKIYFFIFLLAARQMIMRIKIRKQSLNKQLAFILFFLSFSFVASVIPSGSRFVAVGFLFTLLFIARLYFLFPTDEMKKFVLWSLPVFSFGILFGIGYLSISLVSSTIWYGNLPWIIWEGIGYEFIDLF